MNHTRLLSKKCPKCKAVKSRELFNRSTARIDRMSVYCKECENEYKRKRERDKREYDMFGIV